MSADLIGDDACREAFNKARQQRFSVHGLDVVCEPDIFRAGYAAGRDSEIAKRDARMAEFEKELQAGATAVENCELFRAELAAIKAQEPVAIEFRQFMTAVVTGAGLLSCGKQSKGLAAELSATAYKYLLGAPVSEAKAQGVVMPEQECKVFAARYICNWDGEGDICYALVEKHKDGAFIHIENGAPLIEYNGDKILNLWPLCLAAQAAPAEDAWIPVGERLPEPGEPVQVWCEGAEQPGLAWISRHADWSGEWVIPEPQAIGYESITHWMPLPSGPAAHGAQGV